MATPNIVRGQIAIDPTNDLLYYINESNTLVATSLSWAKSNTSIQTAENVIIDGDLTVSGTTVTINAETLLVEDNIIVLNTGVTGSPSLDAGIEVERGTSNNVQLRWNESTDKWQFSNDGTTFYNILGEGADLTANVTGNLIGNVTGNADTATKLSNSRKIELTGPVTGFAMFDGSSNIAISTSLTSESTSLNSLSDVTAPSPLSGDFLKYNGSAWVNDVIDLGTDTNGNYIADLSAGTGIEITNASGEGVTPTVSVNTSVIQTRVSNVSDTEIGYLDGVTSSIQNQIDSKASTSSPTFTGTVSGITKAMVGLENVDNTADLDKPISNAQQTALNLKANVASPTFTGNVNISVLYVDGIEIDPTGASNTQVLKYDSNINKFVPGVASTVAALDDLTDVTITGAVNNQILKYNGSAWVNGSAPGAAGGITYSSNIGDGSANIYTITHNLNTRDVTVITRNNSSPYEVINARWEAETANTVVIDFSTAIDVDSVRASVFAAVSGEGYEPVPGPAMVSLNDAGDVIITSGIDRDFLMYNGSAWVNRQIVLGTDTSGNFVSSLVQGTGIALSNNSGENTTPTISVDTSVIQAKVANVSDTEIGYLDGVTSSIQTQLDAKAPVNNPIFTGTVTIPDNTVVLGTKTTGDYVATIAGGTGISSTASTSGEGTTHILSIGQSVGTTDNVTFAGLTADAITIGVTSSGEIDTTSGNLTIDSTGGTITVDDDLIVTGNATINNDLIVTGNITINGNTTTLNTETITVEDKTIELGSSLSPSNTTANGAGIIVPDGGANKSFTWSSSSLAWSSSEDLNLVSGKVLKINGTEVLSATNYTGQAATVAPNSVTTTNLQAGAARGGFNSTLNNQTASYTLQASDLAKLVTIDSASNTTITVPNILSDGDRIDILRKHLTGEVTISGDTGVTVYGTPGLKLRSQWSGATLVKLANNTWVALGDLKQ